MNTLTVKLPLPLFEHVRSMAERLSTSQSDLVRAAIKEYLERRAEQQPQSAAAFGQRWRGIGESPGEGPGDLSTNPKHMEGFGESAPRRLSK